MVFVLSINLKSIKVISLHQLLWLKSSRFQNESATITINSQSIHSQFTVVYTVYENIRGQIFVQRRDFWTITSWIYQYESLLRKFCVHRVPVNLRFLVRPIVIIKLSKWILESITVTQEFAWPKISKRFKPKNYKKWIFSM